MILEYIRRFVDHEIELGTSSYRCEKGVLKDVGAEWALLTRSKETIVVGFYRSSVVFTHKEKRCHKCREEGLTVQILPTREESNG